MLLDEIVQEIHIKRAKFRAQFGPVTDMTVYITQETFHCLIEEVRQMTFATEKHAKSLWENEMIAGAKVVRVVGHNADLFHPPYKVVLS